MESALIYCREDEKYPFKPCGCRPGEEYNYMMQEYAPGDFRYRFVKYYKELLSLRLHFNILNCKITYNPIAGWADLLMITIYPAEASEKRIISQRVEEDKEHPVFTCFYQALERYPLPGAREHMLHAVIEDTFDIRLKFFVNKAYRLWKNALKSRFPEVEEADFNGENIYVFLKKGSNMKALQAEGVLEKMREACYDEIIKYAGNRKGLPYEIFHIKIDPSGIYQERGSRYYFDSIAELSVTVV